ncbi:hypothetical protein MBLNU459_g3549t1 [Dothideomycetes sp. NU459]
MSADTVTNPVPPTTESKSARKKREKAQAAAAGDVPVSATPTLTAEVGSSEEASTNGDSAAYESPYIKELQKNVRNVTKKLSAMSKLDAILAENPNVSLDELVASRKINADQKAQAQKKPGLQSSLKDLEEQITQYKKVDAEYQSRLTSQRDTLAQGHKSEIEELKQQLKKEAEAEGAKALREKLLVFSQFLRAAAAKRAIEDEADTEESRAFEGALLLVYGGDDTAVKTAENLIDGSDEVVLSVEGQPTTVKYSQIKQASLSFYSGDDGPAEDTVDAAIVAQSAEPVESAPESDPTIAHAGLTEIGLSQTSGTPAEPDNTLTSPAQGSTGDAMANQAAESAWDNNGTTAGTEEALGESFEMIPRDPSEVENPHEPAMQTSTNSWADETNAAAAATSSTQEPTNSNGAWAEPAARAAATPADDGFHEVERRGRGGHRGDGQHRGRGRGRGGHRGGEQRGRGGFRGERRGGGEGGRGRGRGAPQAARS